MASLAEEEARLAAAALLVHAVLIDGDSEPDEEAKARAVLAERFELQGRELDALIAAAKRKEADAVDLYRFTRALRVTLEQPGRQRIVRMLWEVVLADGVIHETEANLVWRVAELLGVSRADRIRLRKEVENAVS